MQPNDHHHNLLLYKCKLGWVLLTSHIPSLIASERCRAEGGRIERRSSPRAQTVSIFSLHSVCTYRNKRWCHSDVISYKVKPWWCNGVKRKLTVNLHHRHRKSFSLRALPHAFSHTQHFDPLGRFPSIHWWGILNCKVSNRNWGWRGWKQERGWRGKGGGEMGIDKNVVINIIHKKRVH